MTTQSLDPVLSSAAFWLVAALLVGVDLLVPIPAVLLSGATALLLLPLLANQQLFGVLSITRDVGHPLFDEVDEGTRATLASVTLDTLVR